MDRVEDRIEQRCDAALICGLGGTQQRRQVTMGCRNEHRRHRSASRDVERVLGQAQQKIRARANRASQFAHIGRIDADRKSRAGELSYRVLEMRKRRVGKTAEVDHIRARLAHRSGTGEDRIDLEFRCIDDFGEYANVVPRQIRLAAALAEIGRQILQLVGAAVERHAELRRKAIEIGAAASGHEHTRCIQWTWQTARDDLLGHQRGDLNADIEYRPLERRFTEPGQQLLEPMAGEMAGQ